MTVYGVDRDGPGISSSANIPPLLSDGTQELTADWDAGPYEIRALTFESDVATGTAPFTIASTTMVANLNADMVDGYHAASFLLVADIDDVPVNGATTVPISSNWAYDHENAADPHTGYRLESADHTHQSTGAQGGQLDHGLALTGLTDDDHTQYALLAGRATGQIIIGGTGASEALALRSTSHGTLGVVALADTGGDVTIGGAATASAIRFLEPSGSGSNYTAFKAQAQAASVTYTLPAADATVSGYALKSDAAGALSWGPAGGVESKQSITQNTHGFAVGDVLYHNGTIFALADASAAATAEVVGIVQAVTDVDTFTLLYGGYIDTLSGLTAGSVYFLSETAGDLTATEPSTVGVISKPLLIASSTTAGYFFNMRGSVVGTASSTLSVENFSGDGSDTTFTLASSPLENNTFVMVEGVYQQKNTYSISGTTLTFSTAPPTGTNNIEVITVGSIAIGAGGRHTMYVPASGMTSRTTNGAAAGQTESTTNKVMMPTLDFDTTTTEYAQFQVAFPKAWDLGTIYAEFFWTAASSSGGVTWGIQAVSLSDDDLIDTAFGTAVEVSDTLIATTDVHKSAVTAAMTSAGTPANGDLTVFQVYRDTADASDTLAADAKLIGIRLTYNTSSLTDD